MIIYILLFLLIASFSVHLFVIFSYIQTRDNKYFNWFIATVISNMFIAITLSIFALINPELIRSLNLKIVLWLLSGFITLILLSIKINIFIIIFKRTKDPAFYHLNYFGKKVYETKIVKQHEFLIFIISLPIFLIIGAYFIARLINLFIYGQI